METSAAHKWGIKIGRIKGQVSSFGNINKDAFSGKDLKLIQTSQKANGNVLCNVHDQE